MNRKFWSALVILAVIMALLLVEMVTAPASWHVIAFSAASLTIGVLCFRQWATKNNEPLPRYFLRNRTSKNETVAP